MQDDPGGRGVALLAHPAWSLNTTEQICKAGDFDGMDIYNSVSCFGASSRPYSGLLADMLANQRVCYPLLAVDDTHFYTGDQFGFYNKCWGQVMSLTPLS